MSTKLKDFYTNLANLEKDSLTEILNTCHDNNKALSQSELNEVTCMTKTRLSPISFKDVSGVVYTFSNLYENDPVGTTYTYSTVNAKATAIGNAVSDYQSDQISDLTTFRNQIADTTFNTYHAATKNLYTDMKTKRNDLDNKMRSLYEDGYTDNQIQNENVVLVNLTWTVLATCVLYFLFVKL